MAEHSIVADSMSAVRERTANALDGSRIVAAARTAATTTATLVRESFLYRWLTAEPDPEVVVIDLRETYTVGPFIAILDRIVDWLAPIYGQSRLKDGVDAIAALSSRVADTRTGRVLVALFEPPEPPAKADEDLHNRDDGDDQDPAESRAE